MDVLSLFTYVLVLLEDPDFPVVFLSELFILSNTMSSSEFRAGLVNEFYFYLPLLDHQDSHPIFKTFIPLTLTISSTSHLVCSSTYPILDFILTLIFSDVVITKVTNVSSDLCVFNCPDYIVIFGTQLASFQN